MLGWKFLAIVALVIGYINRREKPVYLLDFATFEPPEDWKVTYEQIIQILAAQKCFTEGG